MNIPKGLASHVSKDSLANLLEQAALPLGILWLEVVFKASTTGEFFPQILFVALFSCAMGMLLTLPVSFCRPGARAK
jgi:hypothetical protein